MRSLSNKRAYYGKAHLTIVAFIWTIIVLYIVYISLTAEDAKNDEVYQQIQEQIKIVRLQNILLQIKVLDHMSYIHIASAAATLGFTDTLSVSSLK